MLGPASDEAAAASLAAAQQNRYMAFNNAMFESAGRPTHERIVATVRASGLNEVATAKAMQSAYAPLPATSRATWRPSRAPGS